MRPNCPQHVDNPVRNGKLYKPPYNHLTCSMKCACTANMKQQQANQCTGDFQCYQGYTWNNQTCTCDPIGYDPSTKECRHGGAAACKDHVRVEVFVFCLVAEMLGLLVLGFCYRGHICAEGDRMVRRMSRRLTSNASSVLTQTSLVLRQLSQRNSAPLSQRGRYQHISVDDPDEFKGTEPAHSEKED